MAPPGFSFGGNILKYLRFMGGVSFCNNLSRQNLIGLILERGKKLEN